MGPLFLAVAIVPFVELYLLIRIGRLIGAPSTLALVIVTGLLGAWLAKRQGRKVLRAWREALEQGRVPEEGVLGGILVLLGGLLLIVPGVLTDVFGIACLIPATRRMLAGVLQKQLAQQVSLGRAQMHAYDFSWPPGRPTSQRPIDMGQRPLDVGRRPLRRDDVIDTEGEEIKEG